MDKELRVEFGEIVKQVRSELNEDLDESFEGESILKCGQRCLNSFCRPRGNK